MQAPIVIFSDFTEKPILIRVLKCWDTRPVRLFPFVILTKIVF